MNHKDTLTLGAFLTAATRLESPLPENLQQQLSVIAEQFPASIYELHEFVEKYPPLHQQYITALQALPSEGERLKFADLQTSGSQAKQLQVTEPKVTELTVSWEEVEQQLGTSFKDMVLDLIERSHPDYSPKVTEALASVLADMGQSPVMTAKDFNGWLTTVFDNSDEEV